jgi:tRNA modification GTPase
MTAAASETVVAELTPKGRGAVAVVLVAGPDAVRAVGKWFTACSSRALEEIPLGRIAFGHWDGAGGEELVVCRHSAEEIEVHCHGGFAAVEAVVGRLVEEGCQRLTWQEWIHRTAPDCIRAAARIALADAATERTAGILLDQLNGALSSRIRELMAQVVAGDWASACNTTDELLSRRRLGLHLVQPWRLVIFGAPNVGKSSLINALAGYQRAIVSAVPGTTRDVVTVTTAIDGWPVQLFDTAGIRDTKDELEQAGIDLATSTLSRADLAIFVHDAERLDATRSVNRTNIDPSTLAPQAHVIHVLNKVDRIVDADRTQLVQQFVASRTGNEQALLVSALTCEGIPELISTIGRSLAPVRIVVGAAVPFSADQFAALAAAKSAIEERDADAANAILQAMLTGTRG